jgi:probable F420-dependent oxidoreductase
VKLGISPYGLRLQQYVRMAADAEQTGFESVWVADHVVIPAHIRSRFPYAADGESGLLPSTEILDSWVLLSFIAAATERLRLGTYVYILALRHPFITAKAAASLQILSAGRLLLGAGVGWLAEEYEAMGVDFMSRGRDTSEAIGLLRELWSREAVSSDGPAYRFAEVGASPRPPSIPIHLGGHSAAAVTRATRLGDGWLGSPRPAEQLGPHLAEMRGLIAAGLARAGRPRESLEVTGALVGMPSEESLSTALGAGLDRLIISPWAGVAEPPSPSEVADQLGVIADTAGGVLPRDAAETAATVPPRGGAETTAGAEPLAVDGLP